MLNVNLQEIVDDLRQIDEIEEQKIPVLITQLSSVQLSLACRLINSVRHRRRSSPHDETIEVPIRT